MLEAGIISLPHISLSLPLLPPPTTTTSLSLSLSLSPSLSPLPPPPSLSPPLLPLLTQWGVFVVCIEWMVFVCTHTVGHTWKQAFGAAPWWVKMVMDNGKLKQYL